MAMTMMECVAELPDVTSLLQKSLELRAQAEREGFLFFRGLLDAADVLEVRKDVLGVCRDFGWLDGSASLMEGRTLSGFVAIEGDDAHRAFYSELQTRRSLHSLARHPRILAMFEALFDEPVLAHSRNICRTIFPNTSQYTTPAHQDYIHIRGTPDTWTTWIPLGDCPRILGGLALARASHLGGLLPTKAAYGAGGAGIDVPDDTVWLTTDYRAGDVIAFHSYNVHQGQDNLTGNQMRLSVDFRYQPVSHSVDPTSLLPHTCEDSWERIYSHWPNSGDELKYYWKR
jgi:ectoine hydroxylase-related dioxygenase (phytanoyl-CoA dioxygenase family)